MPRCAVNVDLSWPLNPSLLVSLKPGRLRPPWHLWHGLALHCGLNYWWRALLSQCVLPTFKWNSADWAVTASSLPATSTWHLWCGSDCTAAINFQWSLHSEWRSLTITEGWFLSEHMAHSSILYTKETHQNIWKRVSGICDPFFLLRSSSGFQDFAFISYIWFSSVVFCKDGWTYLPGIYFTDAYQNFIKFRWLQYMFILDEAFVCLFLPVKYSLIFAFSSSRDSVTLMCFSLHPVNEISSTCMHICVSMHVYMCT